jgi:formate hydrogenlyase subunit 3/multisubunit Na+/H+ antiporter MnhD subunit
LIGFSLLLYYGRSFDLVVLEKVLATANSPGLLGYYCAMFFLFFGLGAYFLGAPLYGWVRDLYVFAPLPAVFILGLSLPVFGLAVVMRLFTGTFNKIFADALSGPVLSQPWVNFLEVVPALGIVFGGIYILKSKSARSAIGAMITIRMSILLSSILHLTPKSLGGFLFDLIPLSISFCGIIGALFFIKGPVDGRIQSGQVFFILFLLVFIGVPPSPSFISIWQIMSSHFDAGNFGLLMLLFFGVFFMVYGFLRLSTGVFQSNGALTFQVENGSIEQIKFYKLFSLALLVPILALALLADQVIKFAEQSLRFIFW